MSKISVIVPIYNSEKYLQRCVESILAQTFENFELILVDDGSTDSSPQLCDAYLNKDKRIIVIHKENGGVSSARNKGLDVAKGSYITFVDSDDCIDRDMFTIFMDEISIYKNVEYLVSGIKMCTFDNDVILSTVNYEMKYKKYNLKSLFEALNNEYPLICISGPCAKLFRKDIIDKYKFRFDEDMALGEDGYFNLCYLEHCNNILALDCTFYTYFRENDESLFSRYNKESLDVHEKVYNKMRNLITKNNCSDICMINFEKMYYNMLISCIIQDFQNPHKNVKKFRLNTIKRIINNHYIINIKHPEFSRLKDRIISQMIKFGNAKLIYYLFRIYYNSYFRKLQ